MIVRILNDNFSAGIGLYADTISYNTMAKTVRNDLHYKVTHYLVLDCLTAETLRDEQKLRVDPLEILGATYGIYEMDEEEVALWLLKC